MNDIDQLMAAFEAGKLLRPYADVPTIVDLGNALAKVCGVEDIKLTTGARTISGLIGSPDHLIFILADGLGMNFVEAMDRSAFIRGHVVAELQTVFPSTTPVALTALATGEWPSKHAVPGWFVYLPEHEVVATIIRFMRRSDEVDLSKLGITPEQVFPCRSLLSKVERNTLSLLPKHIANTVYSNYFNGSALQQTYETLREAMNAVMRRVTEAKWRTFTYLYTPRIDSVAHEYGTGHSKTWAAINEFERELERLADSLPDSARVVVSADHGLLDASTDQTHVIEPTDELVKCLIGEPWGDARVMYFNVRDDYMSKFRRLFNQRFGERFLLITIEETESLELFGPGRISATARSRMGNLIAISTGADVLAYHFPTKTKQPSPKISHHSGLTPDEMRIPLVVV